ncbi:Uncharacterised protein [uncultured archaeon]|nr:Uncharacterised protein [uncultured archaeon]
MPRKSKKQAPAPVAAVAVASKPGHYDQQRMINLMAEGKSITDIASAVGCSDVYARRVLSTKAPKQYRAYIGSHRLTAAAPSGAVVVAAGPKTNGGAIAREMLTAAQAIEVIARSVAQSAFGDAEYVPKPATRQEMFKNISKGVSAGVKKLSIGFHA